jgi:hypothetical protein
MSPTHPLTTSNPFNYQISRDPSAFYGREEELRTVCDYLLGEEPNSCAIIGESYIGKTSMLRYLTHPQGAAAREDLGIQKLILVYLDASRYIDSTRDDRASVQFWGDLAHALQTRLDPNHQPKHPLANIGHNPIDRAYDIKFNLEKLIHAQRYPVIFALDNFQGIASLPLRDSAWLRAMANDCKCAYVVTSRYLLHLLYHSESWERPSPVWNLFPDRLYLGLLHEEEAMDFILQKGNLKSFWRREDIEFIRKTSGRHPALLRLTCASLYEQRRRHGETQDPEEYDLLESRIYRDASPICNQLWYGLADPELMGVSSVDYPREPLMLSKHQKVLMDVVETGDSTEDRQYLFELEERGLIERTGGKWQVFAGIMYQFVLRQEQVRQMAGATVVHPTNHASSTHEMPPPAFTYLEGLVYRYLQSHIGVVCDKDEIKRSIWKDKLPSDSTLQKIIERIRRKIEPEPENPRFLIAVRGQGYILRDGPTD